MAYIGVAAAPFGGPTLLSLLNMSLKTKAAERVRHADQAQREKAANKFEEEAGMPIEAVGGIVIDEVSFIELGVFGHLDADMRTLLGSDACELLCGGMPLLLAGDCHQKPPPGSTPWHQTMVKVAFGEGENPRRAGATAAKQRGLALLCAARRTELVRLMRARGDEQFIAYQRQMRRAADRQPVPDAFVRALRRVSAADLAADGAWRFAPIGVLSHIERDALNLAQLMAFAREFDLPVVRWRLPLVDDAFASESERQEFYEHEPNLWGYYVEGAPAHLLETIKSVRKLVNGSPVLLDSLQVKSDADRQLLVAAYAVGYSAAMVTLSEPPEAVNVECCGGRHGRSTAAVARGAARGPLGAHPGVRRGRRAGRAHLALVQRRGGGLL